MIEHGFSCRIGERLTVLSQSEDDAACGINHNRQEEKPQIEERDAVERQCGVSEPQGGTCRLNLEKYKGNREREKQKVMERRCLCSGDKLRTGRRKPGSHDALRVCSLV